jgi:hypothetical protein
MMSFIRYLPDIIRIINSRKIRTGDVAYIKDVRNAYTILVRKT